MDTPDLLLALQPVVQVFDELEIPYTISGSVGSSLHGIARATLDIDLVANIKRENVPTFVERLKADYYIDDAMIQSAIQNERSFNLVHLKTMLKIDVFVLKTRSFDQSAFTRRRKQVLLSMNEYFVTTPEDLILHKLEWYELGGRISERQWRDVIGILKVQENNLNWEYLTKWAKTLKIFDLLEKAKLDSSTY